jgi:hypothetical protein
MKASRVARIMALMESLVASFERRDRLGGR